MTKDSKPLYKKFCMQLQKRRYMADQTQMQVARDAGYDSHTVISMLETGVTKIPFAKASDLARAYKVKEDTFYKALIKTRYPDFWDAFLTIIAKDPDLCTKTKDQINEEVDKLIEHLPKQG